MESSRVREPKRTAVSHGLHLRFYGDGISFLVVFSQSSDSGVLPGGARLVWPRWMPERRILEGCRTCGVSFWPFLNSSSWWWLITSVFLTRTSCQKTTHANGYYGAWPGWAVSVSVLPLTGSLAVSAFHVWIFFFITSSLQEDLLIICFGVRTNKVSILLFITMYRNGPEHNRMR